MKGTDKSIHLQSLGLSMSYIDLGPSSGSVPVVLFLHGWLDNSASFQPLMDHLGELPCWFLDLPGHGRSEHLSPNLITPSRSTLNVSTPSFRRTS